MPSALQKQMAFEKMSIENTRNVTAGHEAAADIVRENPDACVECHPLDLASFSSVRSFARKTVGNQPVSAVIHNAGVMAPPYQTTVDGHELTFQVILPERHYPSYILQADTSSGKMCQDVVGLS